MNPLGIKKVLFTTIYDSHLGIVCGHKTSIAFYDGSETSYFSEYIEDALLYNLGIFDYYLADEDDPEEEYKHTVDVQEFAV